MATMVGVKGARELVADLEAGAATVDELLEVVIVKTAGDLVAKVQQHASGRPGPNAPTGDYRGSWTVDHVFTGSDFFAYAVGTDRVQANRLEYGFVGTDSLGRTFDQPPYPHMGPAVDEIEPTFQTAVDAISAAALPW